MCVVGHKVIHSQNHEIVYYVYVSEKSSTLETWEDSVRNSAPYCVGHH